MQIVQAGPFWPCLLLCYHTGAELDNSGKKPLHRALCKGLNNFWQRAYLPMTVAGLDRSRLLMAFLRGSTLLGFTESSSTP